MQICSVPECGRKVIARNLCQSHYARQRRGVPLDKPLRRRIIGATCEIDGCHRKHAARGLCATHLGRQRNGRPLDRPIRPVLNTDDVLQRLRHYAPVGEPNECWEWTRSLNKGYGVISIGSGKVRGAHIVAWELANGRPLPPGMVVRHTCDNPPCTNPAHLILGTHADNVRDRVEHGKATKGEGNSRAKITDHVVREIRRLYATGGWSQRRLAAHFGISQPNIHVIVTQKGWHHVE